MDLKLLTILIAALALAETATSDQAVTALRKLDDKDAKLERIAQEYGDGGKTKLAELRKPVEAPAKVGEAKVDPVADEDADEAFVKLQAKRAKSITMLAGNLTVGMEKDVVEEVGHAAKLAIAENLTVAQAAQKIQAAMAKKLGPIKDTSVSVGDDRNISSLREAIPQAIMLRANPGITMEKFEAFEKREASDCMIPGKIYLGSVHPRAKELRRQSMLGMFRIYLRSLGVDGAELENMGNVALANALGPRALRNRFPKLGMLAESTSDFASITLDAINKTMRFMYLDAKRTWDIWAQRQTNDDFKNINRVVLSEAPDMIAATEGKEINYVAMSDSKETYQLAEYKAGIKLTRRAIINDDLNAFSQIPRAQANSAARKEDDVAYAVLTANANMSDTGALFNSTAVTTAGGHANTSASGTAISISALQAAATAIKKQKGLAGTARLELEPKFLLVPTSIEETTRAFIGSDKVMPVTGATPNPYPTNNPYYNRYTVVGSTRLDDNDVNDWYLMADYRAGQVNTVEVCFLTDEPEPVVRQETDFDTEDVKYLVRHTVAGKAIDFRGLYKQAGA